jgi:hypothetical protein
VTWQLVTLLDFGTKYAFFNPEVSILALEWRREVCLVFSLSLLLGFWLNCKLIVIPSCNNIGTASVHLAAAVTAI